MPLAVSSAAWVSVRRGAPHRVNRTSLPLFGFCLPPESSTTRPSPQAAASRQLSWAFDPFSTSGSGDPLPRALPQPATVRPQGLVPLSTAFARRARAGFVSPQRRSWDSPFGAFSVREVPPRFRGREPTYR